MSQPAAQVFTAYPLEDFHHHAAEIRQAVESVFEGGGYILGGEVERFEAEFAAFAGCRHAVGVANGTDAIELLLRASDIGPGDRVAVPSHTAVASVSAIQRAGADPVFVDIDPDTFTLDPASLNNLLDSPFARGIKAVLAVHLYGHPCDVDRLRATCDERNLLLFEDCAQAHGATVGGRPVGSLGRGAAFSFYPTKNLGAVGDGGAVTTNDEALARRVRSLRQYGWQDRYISAEPGVNSRLDELQAAILRVKLRTLPSAVTARRTLARQLIGLLGNGPGLRTPEVRPGCEHAFHLFVVRCDRRDEILRHLLESGIPAAIHYPAAVHQQPAYRELARLSPPLPCTEDAVPTILSLPLHPYLTEKAMRLTATVIGGFLAGDRRAASTRAK